MNLPPRENPDLFGHEAAENHFLAAWNSGRLPHAWLLTGPEGVGKATFAFRIARFVLSQGLLESGSDSGVNLFGDPVQPETLYLDPDDPVFHRVASAGHADLMTLERTENPETKKMRTSIAVDDVRKAGEFFRLTAAEGGWRVVVVDSADELNISAANALLKILEEPPEKALMLLVSHSPMRLLPTIRSRCCQLALKPLQADAVSSLLSKALPNQDAASIELLATLAEGSAGKAITLAEQDGIALYKEMIALLAKSPHVPVPELHGLGDRLARNGAEEKFRTATNLLCWWIARLVAAQSRDNVLPPPLVREETGCAERLLNTAGVERLMEVWEKVRTLSEQALRQNLDRKHILISIFSIINGAARP